MTATAPPPVLTESDLARVRDAVERIGSHDTASVLASAMPALTDAERAAIAGHARFSHVALLLFPSSLDGLRDDLSAIGVEVDAPTPSVVVRDRLSRRHGIAVSDLEIGILRAQVADRAGSPCELEIFALVTPPTDPRLRALAEQERADGNENHFALAVDAADAVVLSGLRGLVADRGAMAPDGGGYNGHEDATILYFRDPAPADPAFGRLELITRGHFPDVLAHHLRETVPAGTRLLRLMTGAWATQAIATAAELRLADQLGAAATATELAEATGADADSLARLLRYLATLGIVRQAGDGFALTDLGRLLRSAADGSLHPLAQLYGGPFYTSFAGLTESVRTGRESYERVFGAHHFVHMSANPELAELFHRAMAASSAMFTEVARVVDFSAARTVVDIAGGNGELIGQILAAHPWLNGVLVERPHALDAARSTLAGLGCQDRCAVIDGDFTESLPGGADVYLLSRVLHDWDDEQCAAILARVAEAVPDGGDLLVVERLLPEDGGDALAVAWDVHMLCNVGGRERTAAHYRDLLAAAGFELTGVDALPLDAAVLRARRVRR